MYILMQDGATAGLPYGLLLNVIGVLGFAAAVGLGSIAWYNSKRPAGWEGQERPDIIPKIKKD